MERMSEGRSNGAGAVRGCEWVQLPSVMVDHLLWFNGRGWVGNLLGVITLGWRFEDALRSDDWSERFSMFKFGDERHGHAGRALLAYALRRIRWRGLSSSIGVVASIPSFSERLDPAARVAAAALEIAQDLGFMWCGDILRKRAGPSAHELSGREDRRVAIGGTYYCIEPPRCELVMVCDDFVTTGATMAEIARAIQARSPATKVFGVALARNERRGFMAARGVRLTNDHLPVAWANLWDRYVRTRAFARIRR